MRYITLLLCSIFAAFVLYVGQAAANIRIPVTPQVQLDDLTPHARSEVECLAQNMYFEAGKEPKLGQLAVAFVTHNRLQSGFATSYCGVVKQKEGGVCQFSWFCDKKAKAMIDRNVLTIENNSVYNNLTDLALRFYLYTESFKDPTKGAMFFHADYVKTSWDKQKEYIKKIGRHIFYAER